MSTTITLAGRLPSLTELVDALAIPGLRFEAGETVHRFHLDGRSTRNTEVTVGESFEVRMFSLAAPEDVELAVRIAECAARIMKVAEADAEMFGMVPIAQLREIYDGAWAASQAESGIRAIRALVNDGRGPIQVPGPVRAFCVGPCVLEVFGDDLVEMWDAIRAVQWLRARTAGVFVVGEKQTKLAVWLGDEVVFPPVAYALLKHEEDTILVDAKHVPELAGSRWKVIDETQGHIAACDDWPAVFEAARAFSTKIVD